MPNHVHMLYEALHLEAAYRAWVVELTAFSRKGFPGEKVWERLSLPELIPDLKHLKRQIRYVHLNPCRDGLASDPLEWEWSTHRDLVGAAHHSWVDLEGLARMWGCTQPELAKRAHGYISGDPSVKVEGTFLPPAVREPIQIVASWERITETILWVTRRPATSLSQQRQPTRRLALLLARRLGGYQKSELAGWLGVSSRTVSNLIAAPMTREEIQILHAALWILSDRQRFVPRPRPGAWPA